MNLIIVESPTKAKTIAKFVGKDYKIESSYGHIRDLPKSEIGVDIKNDFEPKYVIPTKARQTVSNLRRNAQKADKIILASDEDREGEAIAWHITKALELDQEKVDRIVFHEITKNAILDALKNPRGIDMKLVNAQQARRILDRLVGYELSPFLWKKVAKGLSAGRVQSVAVRLIVEREREIKNFKIEEYWSIVAVLKKAKKQENKKTELKAKLHKVNGKTIEKLEIKNKEQVDQILTELKGREYIITNIEQKESKKNAPKPFTTSTLQQTANRWLGFSAKQTMTVAQKLYELGLITYMRTDSLNLSDSFLNDARNYLSEKLGEKYALKNGRRFKTKSKGAQEAHEAIRPTDAGKTAEDIKLLDKNQYKLYKLIWQRALASQMPEAIVSNTTIDIDALLRQGSGGQAIETRRGASLPYQFRATGQILKFDGYLKIYPEKSKELELPRVEKNEKLDLIKLNPEQHFTKPPARYSDAGLVKVLERYGIGRPSTYAPTIATIIERNYVNRDENKRLAPTDIAFVVNDLLIAHFPKIVDYQFTAKMENDLDDIARGKKEWRPVIRDFYNPFHANLENKYKEINKKDIMPEEKSNEVCDKCGAPMIIKTGRYGKFLACSAFPNCKNIKGLENRKQKAENSEGDEELKKLEEKYKNEVCDKCGEAMIVRNGKYGPFLGCSGYPKCKTVKNINGENEGTGVKCPSCGKGEIIQKRSRRGIFYACNRYPDCKTAFWSKPTGEKCPKCKSLLLCEKNDNVKCSNKDCGYIK
jgi:DNA topoisomerase-1